MTISASMCFSLLGPLLGTPRARCVKERLVPEGKKWFVSPQSQLALPVDHVQHGAVYHGGFCEDAFAAVARGREVVEVAVEEESQNAFWDPGEDGFRPEDVECEQDVDEGVARDDPFLAARQDGGVLGVCGCDEFEGFDGGDAAPYDDDFLVLRRFPIELRTMPDFSLEVLLTRQRGHLGIAACANSSDHAVKASVLWVVDDPAPVLILIHLLEFGLELSLLLQTIFLPQLLDLADNLLAIRIPICPVHGRVEAIHHTVNLQARGIVGFAPDAADTLRRCGSRSHGQRSARQMRRRLCQRR